MSDMVTVQISNENENLPTSPLVILCGDFSDSGDTVYIDNFSVSSYDNSDIDTDEDVLNGKESGSLFRG